MLIHTIPAAVIFHSHLSHWTNEPLSLSQLPPKAVAPASDPTSFVGFVGWTISLSQRRSIWAATAICRSVSWQYSTVLKDLINPKRLDSGCSNCFILPYESPWAKVQSPIASLRANYHTHTWHTWLYPDIHCIIYIYNLNNLPKSFDWPPPLVMQLLINDAYSSVTRLSTSSPVAGLVLVPTFASGQHGPGTVAGQGGIHCQKWSMKRHQNNQWLMLFCMIIIIIHGWLSMIIHVGIIKIY